MTPHPKMSPATAGVGMERFPAAAGLGFLGWFWWHMRSAPPPDLDDQELAAWQEARSARRRRAKLER